MAIVLALACALVYGAADFLGGVAARRVSALAVVVWSQAVGLVVLVPALLILGGSPRPVDLAIGAACGVAGGFAVALLYRGLAIGTMGVVSPITAVLAAAVPVAYAIARGERPAPLAIAGIACALAAVVLVSAATPKPTEAEQDAPIARPRRRHRFPPGIPEAIGAGTAFGFLFIGLAATSAQAGFFPMLAMRVMSLGLIVGGALVLRQSLHVARPTFRTIAWAGALDMSANVLFIVAAHNGPLAIVAVLTSLYPAGTVALAAFALRERLVAVQWVGVVLAFAGVICIAL
ncbi:MAG TPA: EamA family transporter [Candidatus Elarobacter sp.]